MCLSNSYIPSIRKPAKWLIIQIFMKVPHNYNEAFLIQVHLCWCNLSYVHPEGGPLFSAWFISGQPGEGYLFELICLFNLSNWPASQIGQLAKLASFPKAQPAKIWPGIWQKIWPELWQKNNNVKSQTIWIFFANFLGMWIFLSSWHILCHFHHMYWKNNIIN